MKAKKLDIIVLISGSGSNLQAFIDQANELNINIKAVISNKADAYGIERAKQANIETLILSHQNYDSREAFDHILQSEIDKIKPDLIVLAGFMRILSAKFVNHFQDRILNIHPSLLPKYKGLNTHQRAIDAHDSYHGASVHVVTAELDDGPVIIQGRLEISPKDTATSLQQRIHQIEHKIYPQAIKWIANGDIKLYQGKVIEARALDRLISI